MRNARITDEHNLLAQPEITLFYRDNSLYREIKEDLARIFGTLGYKVHWLVLREHEHAKAIRHAARSILSPNGGLALILPDNTCWQAIKRDTSLTHLRDPFGHLDSLTSEAAMSTMFARTTLPPNDENLITVTSATLDAITSIFRMVKEKGFTGTCHLVQEELAEHGAFLAPLVALLEKRQLDQQFPPDRSIAEVQKLCDEIEAPLVIEVGAAIAKSGIPTMLHQQKLTGAIAHEDLVVCDIHYWKRQGHQMDTLRVLPLPLASLIARACELNLLPATLMRDLLARLEYLITRQHTKLVDTQREAKEKTQAERQQNALSESKAI